MLFGYDNVFVCDNCEDGLEFSSNNEDVYMDAENNKKTMNGVVIYEGKDIKSWAKKQHIAYPDALYAFRSVFFADNGKEYFIKK